jgi:hypothetical protein
MLDASSSTMISDMSVQIIEVIMLLTTGLGRLH